ncbi:MAG TPA: NTP transferase domain-containing protein, partial [Anaerolineaceae bacterium]|nr:NTP transferase domain-containing protein [Anaerolineaceae bacterium]
MKTTAVILAAGHGKRMVSRVPKVLHPLARRPMIHYSIDSAAAATTETPV